MSTTAAKSTQPMVPKSAEAPEKHTPHAAAPMTLPFWKTIIFSGVSGQIATTCIYPIDLAKTKLQNQKAGRVGGYTGFGHVLSETWRKYGISGMFKGWPPNVILVFPEKALKLTMNEFFRAKLQGNSDRKLSVWEGMIAGGLAGTCQIVATNPMELLKIQGATQNYKLKQGQIDRISTYPEIIRRLGPSGMYTGLGATFIRDIPFSMIYFSLYSLLYEKLVASSEKFAGLKAFGAGTVAGTLAAGLTTPADVIKTRVQAYAEPAPLPPGLSFGAKIRTFFDGERDLIASNYNRLMKEAAANNIQAHRVFFKGVAPRCMIISPLFGITMFSFETMKARWG